MAISVVRLGDPRHPKEGTRLGTVRRPPRGVAKRDFARRDFYDVWVPDLAPSAPLFSWAKAESMTDLRWKRYSTEYLREMKEPSKRRLIELLAIMSQHADFAVGCYCADETRCHRTLLRDLLERAGAKMA